MTRLPATLFGVALLVGLAAAPAWAQAQGQGGDCGSAVPVARGDTLSAIAERCGTTVEALRQANPQVEPRRLAVGATLALPGGPPADPAEVHPQAAERFGAPGRLESARRQGARHTVGYGETLEDIAARYDTTVPALRVSNPDLAEAGELTEGRTLVIPGLHDDMPRAEAAQRAATPRVEVTPRAAPPGGSVDVTAWGLPADTELVIGGGPSASEWRTLTTVTATSRGQVHASVRLPETVAEGEDFVIVVTRADRLEATSRPIRVTTEQAAAPETRDIVGTLSDEGIECTALRADDGTLYTLAGDTRGFEPGDRVRVIGRPAATSICMQGETLVVDQVTEAGR